MLRLIWKNAWRSKRRTFLTVFSVAVSLFLLSTMLCYISSNEIALDHAGGSLRLVTRHATSLTFELPEAYLQKARDTEHVTMVQGCVWFGGMIDDHPELFSSNIAGDLDVCEKMWDDYKFDPGVFEKWKEEPQGAVIAKRLLARMSAALPDKWKIGNVVTLRSPIYHMTLDLKLIGTCEGPDESILLFRRDYLEKSRGEPGKVGYFWLKVDSRENLAGVADVIDRKFANSEYETKTETEKAFLAGFQSMMGNIKDLIVNIGIAVVVTILLVAANTMAMTARERTTEHAVMRCLGFSRASIAAMFVGESMLIAGVGALVGVGGATLLWQPGKFDLGGMAPYFHMTPKNIGIGFGIALGVGFIAGLLPALGGARRSIVDGLRRVD